MTKQAIFQNPIFHNEDKAREALEAELWPNGPYCRHCGNSDPDKIAKVEGKKHSHRPGLYYCNECQGQFTVTVGTVLERSKIPLTKWLMAAHMFNSGKNGVSAHEIHRTLGVTYKTAWFMMHRLREAMNELNPSPMGGEGKSVQADETYYGNSQSAPRATVRAIGSSPAWSRWSSLKGRARAFHVKTANAANCPRSARHQRQPPVRTAYRRKPPLSSRSAKNLPLTRRSSIAGTKAAIYVGSDGQTTNAVENFFGNFKFTADGRLRAPSAAHYHAILSSIKGFIPKRRLRKNPAEKNYRQRNKAAHEAQDASCAPVSCNKQTKPGRVGS